MMDKSSQHSQFWSKIADRYDSVVDMQIGPDTRAMARERLEREEKLGHAVEFGCGTGFNTEVLAARSDRLVATDLAPGMLSIAKRNNKTSNVTFQQEDCQQTSFPDSVFDTAFLGLVLHFTDPPKALAEMHRILKPGGALIIYNPDPHPLRGWDRFRWLARGYFYGITRYRTKPPKDLLKQVLSEQQLCDLLANSGFNVLLTETIRNSSLSYNIPIEYIKAAKTGCSRLPESRTAAVGKPNRSVSEQTALSK
jgi:ubiquinone/menaquinone biosynthesis C-methylase UbiE